MIAFFIFSNSNAISTVSSPIRTVVSRVDSIISAPFRLVSSINEEARNLFDTYSENKILNKKVAELESQSDLVSSLTEENQKLSREINSSSSISSQFSVTGQVIVRNPVSWYDSLSVRLGKKNHVRKNMLAVSNSGLIGFVTDVDSTTSSIRLLSNGSHFDVPVKISTSSGDVYGILTSYDSEKGAFLITDLNASTTINSRDVVVTSGLDGETIANISVGTVSSVNDGSDSLKSRIYVTPTADFSDIPYVTIIGD